MAKLRNCYMVSEVGWLFNYYHQGFSTLRAQIAEPNRREDLSSAEVPQA